MFEKIKDWFFSHVISKVEWAQQIFDAHKKNIIDDISNLSEEVHILKLLTKCPKIRTINCYRIRDRFVTGKFSTSVETYIQDERDKLTKEGYKFLYNKTNGDEVWVEDPNFVPPVAKA